MDVVKDGQQAIDYLFRRGTFQGRGEEHPAVVLLDLKLPKLNGLEVLARLKGDPELRTIPVVMLTSSREEPDLKRAYGLGVNAYVVKPVGFNAFTSALKELGLFWAILNEPPPGSVRKDSH
ncbi:response regulator [Cystobacter fuscus]